MIVHKDINGKALALLLITIFSMIIIFQAEKIPPRQRADIATANPLEAVGGRVYSLLPERESGFASLSLGYLVPGSSPGDARQERITLELLSDAGMLKGYSLPPDRIVFDHRGRAVTLPVSPRTGEPRQASVVYNGNREKPRVALTFDDGPGLDGIIDILSELRVPATIFPSGSWSLYNTELIRIADDRGFEIGNHTFSHARLIDLPDERIVGEVRDNERAFTEATGVRIAAFLRPPYGDTDSRVEQIVANLGYITVNWSRDTLDWHPGITPELLRERATSVSNGDIVLMHTQGVYTTQMLPEIVRILREKGFELTTVSGVLQP